MVHTVRQDQDEKGDWVCSQLTTPPQNNSSQGWSFTTSGLNEVQERTDHDLEPTFYRSAGDSGSGKLLGHIVVSNRDFTGLIYSEVLDQLRTAHASFRTGQDFGGDARRHVFTTIIHCTSPELAEGQSWEDLNLGDFKFHSQTWMLNPSLMECPRVLNQGKPIEHWLNQWAKSQDLKTAKKTAKQAIAALKAAAVRHYEQHQEVELAAPDNFVCYQPHQTLKVVSRAVAGANHPCPEATHFLSRDWNDLEPKDYGTKTQKEVAKARSHW